jgi:hypothetical protein
MNLKQKNNAPHEELKHPCYKNQVLKHDNKNSIAITFLGAITKLHNAILKST